MEQEKFDEEKMKNRLAKLRKMVPDDHYFDSTWQKISRRANGPKLFVLFPLGLAASLILCVAIFILANREHTKPHSEIAKFDQDIEKIVKSIGGEIVHDKTTLKFKDSISGVRKPPLPLSHYVSLADLIVTGEVKEVYLIKMPQLEYFTISEVKVNSLLKGECKEKIYVKSFAGKGDGWGLVECAKSDATFYKGEKNLLFLFREDEIGLFTTQKGSEGGYYCQRTLDEKKEVDEWHIFATSKTLQIVKELVAKEDPSIEQLVKSMGGEIIQDTSKFKFSKSFGEMLAGHPKEFDGVRYLTPDFVNKCDIIVTGVVKESYLVKMNFLMYYNIHVVEVDLTLKGDKVKNILVKTYAGKGDGWEIVCGHCEASLQKGEKVLLFLKKDEKLFTTRGLPGCPCITKDDPSPERIKRIKELLDNK